MRIIYRTLCVGAIGLLAPPSLRAAEYRVESLFGSTLALPGETVALRVEVQTLSGDNLVGFGHLSFAIDLLMSGSLGASGSIIQNVQINTAVFDNTGVGSTGHASGNQYVGTSGITNSFTPPHPGAQIDDIVVLFDFQLTVPLSAQSGETVTIAPVEGLNENLAVIPNAFDPVAPQTFSPLTITVVPEPAPLATVLLLAIAMPAGVRRRSSVSR